MAFIRTVWFWISFWIMTIVMFAKLFAEHFLASKSEDPSLLAHQTACQWGQMVFKLNPGWSIRVEGKENLPQPGSPSVIVANHRSSMDICAIFATDIQFRWLSKKSVFKIPVIGQAMNWAGYVPIDRGNSQSHKEALNLSSRWLQRGISMLFFPEGTRSTTDQLRPFKAGAFNLAEEHKVPITPIAVIGTNKLIKKASFWIQSAAPVIIRILPAQTRREQESTIEFKDRIRKMIQAECANEDSGHF